MVNHHYYNYKGYLDVYDSFGLLTPPRTLLGHGIYLTDIEFEKKLPKQKPELYTAHPQTFSLVAAYLIIIKFLNTA